MCESCFPERKKSIHFTMRKDDEYGKLTGNYDCLNSLVMYYLLLILRAHLQDGVQIGYICSFPYLVTEHLISWLWFLICESTKT